MEEDRWVKLEEIVRKVVKEEIKALGKKPKINLVNGKFAGISADQLEAWTGAYAGVDIESEIRRAAAWCVSNPTSAPKSDFGRYLNAWLSREQNRAAVRSIPTERPTQTKMKLCVYCERTGTDQVNGRWACNTHFRDAMDNRPIPHMRGIVAKPVAGA